MSIGWFRGKITGNSHISWENLWFPVDFPLSQPIEYEQWKDGMVHKKNEFMDDENPWLCSLEKNQRRIDDSWGLATAEIFWFYI